MEDQGKGHHHQQGQVQQQHPHPQDSSSPSHGSERSEPVRSRWTPKPEQILILESIFNSGMVNPPKEETVRIRKLLEKFGSVGDANVFYWFQNRRSRSRRRQRQLQASLDHRNQIPQPPQQGGGATAIPYDPTRTDHSRTPPPPPPMAFPDLSGSSSSSGGILQNQEPMDPLFSVSPQMGFPEIDPQTSALYPPDPSAFNYHCGLITVFINGVATEVPRGPMDIRTMFGQDVVLVHSSGVPLPTNEFGYLMQSLQHGESYFLMVSKPT